MASDKCAYCGRSLSRGDHDPCLEKWMREYDTKLAAARPDRYLMSEKYVEDGADPQGEPVDPRDDVKQLEWMEPVIDEMEQKLPIKSKVVSVYVKQRARDRDGLSQRRGNEALRRMFRDQQRSAGWLDYEDLTISVEVREPVWGGNNRFRVAEYRVRIGALTTTDLDLAEIAERRRMNRDLAARIEGCDARQFLADEMRRDGAESFAQWLRLAIEVKAEA